MVGSGVQVGFLVGFGGFYWVLVHSGGSGMFWWVVVGCGGFWCVLVDCGTFWWVTGGFSWVLGAFKWVLLGPGTSWFVLVRPGWF